ncbi:MAG: sulfite exporter TauE/SafE family protein [Bacteroidota bacterium]
MDFGLYYFMFPVAVLVACIAMICGIGGAAIFTPIFMLIFPLFGEEYLLQNPLAAITAALLTSTFGFASGFIGYYRKGWIDYSMGRSFLKLAIPFALMGVFAVRLFPEGSVILFYGILMLIISAFIVFGESWMGLEKTVNTQEIRSFKDKSGKEYSYSFYKAHKSMTSLGAFLTGLISVGIGEIVMPQFLKRGKIPFEIAAGTSVLIVICTVMTSAITHVFLMINKGGMLSVPWNLVVYTIPGVIIGGQIGPALQGKFDQKKMEKGMGFVFFMIGLAMILSAK